MKTQWNRTKWAILLSVILLTGVNAQPGGGRGYGPQHPDNQNFVPGQGMAQLFSLDLSTEQQEQMKALRLEHYKVMKPLRLKMAELRAREQTLLSEEPADLKAINQVIDEQTRLMNQIWKNQVEHRLAIREILTDEQQMKLDQHGGFAANRGACRGPGQGPCRNGVPRHRNLEF
jgi:Spy/CpxP family protein refolding chaperone